MKGRFYAMVMLFITLGLLCLSAYEGITYRVDQEALAKPAYSVQSRPQGRPAAPVFSGVKREEVNGRE